MTMHDGRDATRRGDEESTMNRGFTARMGVNALAAAQGREASSTWSAGTAKKCSSGEASSGGVACISSAAAPQTMRYRRSAVSISRRQAAAAVYSRQKADTA